MKRGVYEQGRKISKPPPDVGERRGPLRTSCFYAGRPEQWPTRSQRDLANFGKMDFYDNSPDRERTWITATSCVTGRRSNQLNYAPANSLKMISHSLHSRAVSCTA